MNRLFRYKNGEIKLILNETPMHKDYKENYLKELVKKHTFQISTSFSIGIELKMHRGGRICYGMLIAEIQPREMQEAVQISIAYTSKNTIRYENSLLLNDAMVFKGLPEEYVGKVCHSICETIDKKNEFPQCEICFEYAANCEVGSSPMVFGIITEIIGEIIYANSLDEIFDIDIADFTQKYVKNINLYY